MTDTPFGILGSGMAVPEGTLTNADLSKMVDTSDEWILKRTGVRERHIADAGVATSDLAAEAARGAIAQAHLTPSDIEFLVVGTTTPDMFFPSTACLVHLDLPGRRRLIGGLLIGTGLADGHCVGRRPVG